MRTLPVVVQDLDAEAEAAEAVATRVNAASSSPGSPLASPRQGQASTLSLGASKLPRQAKAHTVQVHVWYMRSTCVVHAE